MAWKRSKPAAANERAAAARASVASCRRASLAGAARRIVDARPRICGVGASTATAVGARALREEDPEKYGLLNDGGVATVGK